MTLHIFNPEHDIALASNLSNFTAPHAGRQLRHDLGFLPAIWASAGDVVLVDDEEQAQHAWKRLAHQLKTDAAGPAFVTANAGLHTIETQHFFCVEPWGWDMALRAFLIRKGMDESLLPSVEAFEEIRQLSHRRVAAHLLPKLRVEGTLGEAVESCSWEEVKSLAVRYERLVLKAPWSSSGRGLRFLDVSRKSNDGTLLNEKGVQGWFNNLLAKQGSVMAEPYYHKVKDFGMEFDSDGKGQVTYLGLSLFHTENGAYTGNVLATEAYKQEVITRYVSTDLLCSVRDIILHQLGKELSGKYSGPFGVDMMVCAAQDNHRFLLHPCVEINLRRTMGHVALAAERRLNPTNDDEIRHVMTIDYSDGHYKLLLNQYKLNS